MLFSANFFTNEVTNAKAAIKFGTEANKKLHPVVVAHVSFANHKSVFAGFKAHREALIADGYGEDGKLSNGIRKAIDRVKPAKEITPDHIVTFTVSGSKELIHLIVAGDSAFVSAPNMDCEDSADCKITFGRRKEVAGKAIAKFTKSGNPYFQVMFNTHLVKKEEIVLPAYEGEEKARIENCEAFADLDAMHKAVNAPVQNDIVEDLKAEIEALKAVIVEQRKEIEELKAAREVVASAPVAKEVENEKPEEADLVEVKTNYNPSDLLARFRAINANRTFTASREIEMTEEEEQKRNAAFIIDAMHDTFESFMQ
ncbi:TPA: hypothetical protein H1V70_000106 [Salmonella enterica]|nr:hypothetical protein [Salmonella enterica]